MPQWTAYPIAAACLLAGACSPDPAEETPAQPPGPEASFPYPEQLRVFTIPVGDHDVHALELGDPAAPCVLFLHGARYSASDWHENGTLALVASKGWRALAVDVPGFGGTGGGQANEFEFLPALFEAAQLHRPIVVAPSMGGLYALPVLYKHKDSFGGLVPIAPVGIRSLARPLTGAPLPTIVVWGADDEVISPGQADELVRLIPGARKEVIPASGHPCYLERAEEFHEILLRFLDGLKDD